MKKTLLLLALRMTVAALLVHPHYAHAQTLEDSIEDELDKSSADDNAASGDDLEAELDEGDSSSSEQAAKKEEEPKAEEAKPEEEQKSAQTIEDNEDLKIEEEGETEQAKTNEKSPEQPAPKAGPRDGSIYAETLSNFDDHANTDFENRLYRIFSNRKQVPEERWASLASKSNGGLYRVQRGDTLWDISSTFFGDGQFWPKLWSENSKLTNPHEITVGKGIAFLAGTEESAPLISVTDLKAMKPIPGEPIDLSAEPTAPVYPDDSDAQLTQDDLSAGTVIEEQPIVGGRPDIPEPLVPRSSVLRRLPPSFLEPVPASIERTYDNTGLDIGRRSSIDTAAKQTVAAYISERKPDSLGKVVEMETGEHHAGVGQAVFIKLKNSASIGQRFSVVSVRDKIKGYPVIDVGGTIEIRNVVSAEDNKYRAMIVDAVGPVEQDALIVETALPRAELSRKGNLSQVEAKVIGGQFDDHRMLMGPGSAIFINKGKNDGLQANEVIAIRSNRKARRDTGFGDYKPSVAVGRVVRVEESVATVVLVEGYDDVQVGDLTGGPLPQPQPLERMARTNYETKNIEERPKNTETYKEERDGDIEAELDE